MGIAASTPKLVTPAIAFELGADVVVDAVGNQRTLPIQLARRGKLFCSDCTSRQPRQPVPPSPLRLTMHAFVGAIASRPSNPRKPALTAVAITPSRISGTASQRQLMLGGGMKVIDIETGK
jgi:hypothetical protein